MKIVIGTTFVLCEHITIDNQNSRMLKYARLDQIPRQTLKIDQKTQENNNSRKTTIPGKQQFYLVSVIANKKYILYILTRTNFRSEILGDLE